MSVRAWRCMHKGAVPALKRATCQTFGSARSPGATTTRELLLQHKRAVRKRTFERAPMQKEGEQGGAYRCDAMKVIGVHASFLPSPSHPSPQHHKTMPSGDQGIFTPWADRPRYHQAGSI